MAKSSIKDFACKPFCSFYREGEKDELICNGARLVEKLLNKGILTTEAVTGVGRGPWPVPARNAALDEAVCRSCPFRPDGCDFQSEAPPPDSEPCGGYILLDLLAGKGVITTDLIAENDDE